VPTFKSKVFDSLEDLNLWHWKLKLESMAAVGLPSSLESITQVNPEACVLYAVEEKARIRKMHGSLPTLQNYLRQNSGDYVLTITV